MYIPHPGQCWFQSLDYLFEDGRIVSESLLHSPDDVSLHLAFGWLIMHVLSHCLVWLLAWRLRQLPGLRQVLETMDLCDKT